MGNNLSGNNRIIVPEELIFTNQDTNITIKNKIDRFKKSILIINLKRIIFDPNSTINEISDDTFSNLFGLQSIILPPNLKVIKKNAFLNCNSLQSIEIPCTVISIEDNAFIGCNILSSVTFNGGNITLGNNVFPNKNIFFRALYVTNEMETLKINNQNINFINPNIKYINNGTSISIVRNNNSPSLNDKSTLNIIIPEKICNIPVVEISDEAYMNYNIKSISIPDSVTRIGNSAFSIESITNGIENIYINPTSKLKIIGMNSFYRFRGSSINLPDSLTEIGNYAFVYSNLTELTIPLNVNKIGDGILMRTDTITKIYLKCPYINIRSLTSKMVDAYYYHNSWDDKTVSNLNLIAVNPTKIIVPNNINRNSNEYIQLMLNKKNFKSIIFENNSKILNIADGEFFDCKFLKEVILPSNLKSIDANAFNGCSLLESINIPKSVTKIDEYAFSECKKLNYIFIPKSVTFLGDFAFSYCDLLSLLILDCSCEIPINIINKLTNLTRIKVYYNDENKIKNLKNANKNADYILFDNTFFIGPDALEYENPDKTIKSVKFFEPFKINKIRNGSFINCTLLTSINIPNSVTLIEGWAFSGCTSLNKVIMSNSLKHIEGGAFYNCTSLTDIIIPDSVTFIDSEAFHNCSSLTSIILSSNIKIIKIATFSNTKISNIIIPDSVTEIEDSAFNNCLSLTNIIIPSNVKTIGTYAFFGCSSLKSIYFKNPNILIYDDFYISENPPIAYFDTLPTGYKEGDKWKTMTINTQQSFTNTEQFDNKTLQFLLVIILIIILILLLLNHLKIINI